MDSLDLNFLNEDEVESIVRVIERDFELKAAEKARLCKLRKSLLSIDERSSYISKAFNDGSVCLMCSARFLPFLNPRKECKSCSAYTCKSCSIFMKKFNNYVCKVCSKQKDLMAMNCSWFYQNNHRKYMEGGSQIVANSLSEYPRKNIISSSILSMVKGTQITKFKHQINEVTSSATESLLQLEACCVGETQKTRKYEELLDRYCQSVASIVVNTSDVLYITLENYNKKLSDFNKGDESIDYQVLSTVHEEVEMIVGKKINIKRAILEILQNRKKLEDLQYPFNLETVLSNALVEKLAEDHVYNLLENKKLPSDTINKYLISKTRRSRLDSLELDHVSVSQAPSRQGTFRHAIRHQNPHSRAQYRHMHNQINNALMEVSQSNVLHEEWPDDNYRDSELRNNNNEDETDSQFYRMSSQADLSNTVSLLWQQKQNGEVTEKSSYLIKTTDSPDDHPPTVPKRENRGSMRSRASSVKQRRSSHIYRDSDMVSIGGDSQGGGDHQELEASNNEDVIEANPDVTHQGNWMLNARCPVASLVSLSAEVPEKNNFLYQEDHSVEKDNGNYVSRESRYRTSIELSANPFRTATDPQAHTRYTGANAKHEEDDSLDSGIVTNNKAWSSSKIPKSISNSTRKPSNNSSNIQNGITERVTAEASPVIQAPPRKRRISSKSSTQIQQKSRSQQQEQQPQEDSSSESDIDNKSISRTIVIQKRF